jgi:hypothetical protein
VIDEVVQGVFEGARQQLPFEINGDEARAGVDVSCTGPWQTLQREQPYDT